MVDHRSRYFRSFLWTFGFVLAISLYILVMTRPSPGREHFKKNLSPAISISRKSLGELLSDSKQQDDENEELLGATIATKRNFTGLTEGSVESTAKFSEVSEPDLTKTVPRLDFEQLIICTTIMSFEKPIYMDLLRHFVGVCSHVNL